MAEGHESLPPRKGDSTGSGTVVPGFVGSRPRSTSWRTSGDLGLPYRPRMSLGQDDFMVSSVVIIIILTVTKSGQEFRGFDLLGYFVGEGDTRFPTAGRETFCLVLLNHLRTRICTNGQGVT